MATSPTASVTSITPSIIGGEGFELSTQTIIPSAEVTATFVPFQDIVEVWAYDPNNNLLGGDSNFQDYILIDSPSGEEEIDGSTSELKLNPEQDSVNLGFDIGTVNLVYNFIRPQLGSSNQDDSDLKYYLAEISSDRTELRFKSNYIDNNIIISTYNSFKAQLNSNENFADEFYVNFGDNEYQVGINCTLDTSVDQFSVLVKLYDALPPQFSLDDLACFVIKPAESLAYNIQFPELPDPEDFTYIKGPNYKLKVNEFLNNSTNLKSKNELLQTNSSGSLDELQNILNRKGVTLTPNYSYDTFNEFVNFSSAKKRIENFVEKVTQIQSYQADIDTLSSISGPTSESISISSSVASAYNNIQNLITNFDGYEYFLYYGTGSSSYPKTGSAYPFELLPTTNASVSVWLGSDVENTQYYGGILLSASLYDYSNQNWLYYTIPEFIRDNSNNNQYLEFSNMVGQHFDEIWLYTRAVTEKLNTTSELNDGVPLDLADDVITSLGYTGFGNNFNNQDNFIGLVGEDNGSYVPPTGSELITNYIAVNGGTIVNYWDPDYSWEYYVQSLSDPGYPYAIDKVSKEIYKRLYHNMNYLVKKKGTIAGLRQLINIWGIPNTILRINEFGGKDRDNSDDYDLWYNRYSYAYTPVSTQNVASSSVVFPWMPLERNRIVDSKNIVPDSFQFRFKTTGYPSSSYAGEFFTQSLAVKKSDGDDTSTEFDFGISLFYEPVATGSYSGSASSEYENWGKMRFYLSGSSANGGVATSDDIYLPFFDKGWWTVMLQRDQHVSASDNTNATTYTLYAKNTIYNGWDGAQIGFEGSASITSDVSQSINEAWNKFGTSVYDGIYLGGFVSGSTVGSETLGLSGKIFSGSLQEFRYYSNDIPEATFNDFVMNPESIEGNAITGSQSSFDIVNFRAPLGNELESIFTSSYSSSYSESMQSMHPAIQGQAPILITGSFFNPTTSTTSSEYRVLYYENTTNRTFSKTNTEVYFLDQPAIGFRNRISDKIQLRDGDDFGNILSNRISIQQDYQISRSYTENINNLEVAFSPQDEVNDDIIASFGYGVIADAIADPRFISSSDDYYPQLRKIAESYFKKYTEGNVYDYLRLIKYFDNSIFQAIKAYVPARTSLSTGIVIKQHMLERNRFQPVQITEGTPIAVTPSGALNTPIIMENIVLSGSIDAINQEAPSGSTGGSANRFNYVDSSFLVESGSEQGNPHSTPFGKIVNTQSYEITNETVLGLVEETINNQHEFYDGEFSGSEEVVTSQSAFYNPFIKQSNVPVFYTTEVKNLDPLQSSSAFFTQLSGFNISGDVSAYTASGQFQIALVDVTVAAPTFPKSYTNLQATGSNGLTGVVLDMDITASNGTQPGDIANNITIVNTGSGWNGNSPVELRINNDQFENFGPGQGVIFDIGADLLSNTSASTLSNQEIDQFLQGPAYLEVTSGSSDISKTALANGYRYIPSSSLVVATGSLLDSSFVLPGASPSEGIQFQPSDFNQFHKDRFGPTQLQEGVKMQPINRPLVIGLWRQDWGSAITSQHLTEIYVQSWDSNGYNSGSWWQSVDTLGGPILNQMVSEEVMNELINPDLQGINTPATRSFYVSYVGIPYVNSPSINLAGSSSLGNVITTNTVEGIGVNALQNPSNTETLKFKAFSAYTGVGLLGNLDTPTLKADLTAVFPSTASYTYIDTDGPLAGVGFGIDYRIIDLSANKQRTSLSFYNTDPIINTFTKNWNNYLFQIYQNNEENNVGQRPILQYGVIPTVDQLAQFGDSSKPSGATVGSGLVGGRVDYKQLFKVTDSSASENTYFIATTNRQALLPYLDDNTGTTYYRLFSKGMDIWAYDDFGSGLEIRPVTEVFDFTTNSVLTIDTTETSSGLFTNPSAQNQQFNGIYQSTIIPDLSNSYNRINGKYYVLETNPTILPGVRNAATPQPNNNFAHITASWDTHQSYSGTQNDYDVKPINTTRPSVGSTVKASNRYVLSNFYGARDNALLDINANTPTKGTSSLYPFLLNTTSSFPDLNYTPPQYYSGSYATVPTALSINNQSVNPTTGNTIQNEIAFSQDPNIKFTIGFTGSLSSFSSSLGPSNIIDTNQLTLASQPFTFGAYTNLYQPSSRVYYGTVSGNGGFNFSTLYSQYNIDPYIEDTGIGFFENTIYFATPNNYNDNRPNKFKFVVENQNGINTTSNLAPIFSQSAQQVATPESNYTMLASILPRYSGSKVTSANYNFYSAPTPPKNEKLLLGTGSFEILNTFNATGSTLTAAGVTQSNTTGIGSGAEFTFNLATTQSIGSIVVTSGGKNYKPGDALIFTSQSLGATVPNGLDLTLLLNASNFKLLKPTEFADGTSGSWIGDQSYGKTAALDKNPIYFAHFKTSRNNLELDDTYTFSIDQLILAPFEDVSADSLSTPPQTVDINGSNNRLLDVTSTFEKGRKASITYQVPIQTYPVLSIPRNTDSAITQSPAISRSVVTNYQTLTIGDNEIFQGGAEFETILTTQPDGDGPNFLESASITRGLNIGLIPESGSTNGREVISYLGTSISSSGGNTITYGHEFWAFASGSDSEGGYIDLKGGPARMSASLAPGSGNFGFYFGDILAIAHSYNYWVKDQLLSEYTASAATPVAKFKVPGLPTASSTQSPIPVASSSLANYNTFNFSSSEAGANVLGYEDFGLPFLIERGDEIRVTYDINFTGSSYSDITPDVQALANYRTQDFVVKDIGFSVSGSSTGLPSIVFANSGPSASISSSRLFDRIYVNPNPAELAEPIPSGSIYQFTIRRKINADDRIIIYQTPPINALGSQTPTGDGYLIPNDFTPTQKKNVQTLINQLKNQNAVNTSTTAQQSPGTGPSTA